MNLAREGDPLQTSPWVTWKESGLWTLTLALPFPSEGSRAIHFTPLGFHFLIYKLKNLDGLLQKIEED